MGRVLVVAPPASVAVSTSSLRRFTSFLAERDQLPVGPQKITRELLERYRAHVHTLPVSGSRRTGVGRQAIDREHVVAARDNGFRAKAQERIVLDTVGRYRTAMATFAGMTNLDVWYAHLDTENVLKEFGSQLKPKLLKRTKRDLAKARTKDSMTAFSKLTHVVHGQARIIDQQPLIVPIEQLSPGDDHDELLERLSELLRDYRETLDFDRRVLLDQFQLADFPARWSGSAA